MSSATASRPLNSMLLAALMITSSMAVALTAMPWMADTVIADGTYDGSDASDNSSSPSQATTFDMAVNGTLNSTDQEDWYYVELYSGDSVDFEANCLSSSCGTMMSFEPGTQGSMSYSLTTNSADVNYSFTNFGSSVYNLTFGFENWALQNSSTYVFEMSLTPGNTSGGNGSSNPGVYAYTYSTYYNLTDTVSGTVWTSNLSSGVNYSVTWSIYEYNTSQILGSNMTNSSFSVYYNDFFSFNNVSAGSYVLAADLWNADDSQWVTSASSFFYVGNAGGGGGTSSPGLTLTNWATNGTSTDYDTNYTTSDVIWGSVWTNNTASGTNYSVTWLVYDYTYTVVASNLTNTSFNNYYSDSFQIASNMSVGYYALTANLFNHDSGTLIDVASSYFAINNVSGGGTGGGNGTGGNGTNGSGQNDMGTGGDVGWAQLTNFNNTLHGTIGGNDSSDSYYILLYPGDELEFDANCLSMQNSSQCSITMQANSSSVSANYYYNLTTNYSDSVFFYNNTNSVDEYVYITFTGSSAIEEDYEFYAAVSNNNQNGTGGNGNQSSTDPTLNLNITEEYDWGNGNGANYTFELQIDDLDVNHTYSFFFGVWNATDDDVVNFEIGGSTGNSSITLSSPFSMYIDSGCYLAAGFVYDETTGYEVPFVVDFVALHSTCTTVFADAMGDVANSGDDLEAIFHLVDVNPGTTYTIEWQVKNDTTLIGYGNFTSYNSTSDFYDFEANIDTTGWADDCYSLWAELEVNGTVIPNAFQYTDSQFILGNGTCADPSIWVGTDNGWYSNTSEVQVTIEAHDLDDTMTYTVDWYVFESNGNMHNWSNYSISNTDWSENTFSFWYMSDECYLIEVDIYDEQGNHLDYDATNFDVGQGCNTQGSQAWVELGDDSGHWDLGETIDLEYYLNDLTLNNSYYMEWNIHDRMDWNEMDSGSMELNFTTVESYSSTIDASGLPEGCYWMEITLYDASMNGAYMDSDNQEFSVGDVNCHPLYVNMQTRDISLVFDPDPSANFSFEVGNMMIGSNYSLIFKLFDANNLLNETTWDFMAYNENIYDYINFGYLQTGCYMVQVYLLGEDGDYTNVGEWFKVGNVYCGSIHLEMIDRHTVYMTSETVMFDMTIFDGENNRSINFDYELHEYNGDLTQEFYGSFNITINSNEQNMSLGFGNLSDGCYSLLVSWSETNGDYREEHADFAVGNSTTGCWNAGIWIHSPDGKDNFPNNEAYHFTIVVEDINAWDGPYTASWSLHHASNGTEATFRYGSQQRGHNGTFNATNGATRHLENLTFGWRSGTDWTISPDECYVIEAAVYDSTGASVDSSEWMFSTGDGDCWPPQIETWYNEWDENSFEVKAVHLDIGMDYYLEAHIFDDDDNLVFSVNESEFAWHDVLNLHYNVSSLGDGCYYANAWLYDDAWNLIDETDVWGADEDIFSIGEANCWLNPGMDFHWNGDGEIQFNIWDLKESDEYELDIEVWTVEENGEHGWDSAATHNFTAIEYEQNINVPFDLREDQEYWVNVSLIDSNGNIVLNEEGHIWAYQNQPIVITTLSSGVIGSGDDLELDVQVFSLNDDKNYELLVKLLDDDRNELDSRVEPSVTEGEYEFIFIGLVDGFYHIDVQLFDTDDVEYSVSNDNRHVCVGDGCPTGEQTYGNSNMNLTVNWDENPFDDDTGCYDMSVLLVPEQRWVDAQNGDATYGAYPDWWAEEWPETDTSNWPDVTTSWNFSYNEIPSGNYAIIIEFQCYNGIVEYWIQGHNHGTVGIHTFTNGTTTDVEIDLETRIDDGNDHEDDLFDFMEGYSTGDYTFRIFLKDGVNGPELVVSVDMYLDPSIIVDIDSEEGDGDGLISTEENNMIQDMLSMEMKEDDWEHPPQWNGIDFTAADLILSSYEITGLVNGDDIIFRDYFVWSVDIGEDGSTLSIQDEESAGRDPCDLSDEGDISLTYLIAATSPYEVISVEGTNSNFAEDANGIFSMELGCGDLMPGELFIAFGEEDEGGEGGEGGEENNTTNTTNTPPSCFIHWYRDGDDLTKDGMALLTEGDTIDEITVTEGDTFTIYLYCWDDDGDEMTLSIKPPFGSDASFNGTSVSEFVQLTVPTGFAGKFEFEAEWSDEATGGEFDFDIIIESAEDNGDDENEESDSTSAASFVPGFTGVFTIAAFLGAVLVMIRREQEE